MQNRDKISHQGIQEFEPEDIIFLKTMFSQEFLDRQHLVTNGYFIGKALLKRILSDNDDAEGVVISFGLNAPLSTNGQLQLIIEPANGNELADVIDDREKYATSGPGFPGPDSVMPAIKPTTK